jgi:glycosyltransferase involved in cell wall biosynthesis
LNLSDNFNKSTTQNIEQKNKIKILRILNRFNVGGPVYNAVYLTKYINANKFETFLIGGESETHEQSASYILNNEGINFKKIRFMRRAINPLFDLIALFKIIIIIYKYKPDIIHTHAAKSGLLGRIAYLFYPKKVKIIHTYHGNVFDGYFSAFKTKIILIVERLLAKISTKIISISNTQKQDLVNKFKICDEDKIEVIPLGFDLFKFTRDIEKKRLECRQEFSTDMETILITIIGRVVPIKNHKLFIDVINYCKSKTTIKIKALVVGDGDSMISVIDYTKNKSLSYSYKNLDIQCDVLFTSWRSDIDRILAASDILCLTSINEGTPVSIIESMASNTASISTDVGGVSDIIENGVDGIVSDSDYIKYSENLLDLINNKEIRDKLALNGQIKSLEKYNFNVLVKNMEFLYLKLMNEK